MSVENDDRKTLERDQVTQDFLTGLKEREELKAKLHEKERECNTLKGTVYDMTKKLEDVEKQVSWVSMFISTLQKNVSPGTHLLGQVYL